MGKSKIEWTDEVWNPIVGCSRVSEGCRHCYAERMAKRLRAMGTRGYGDVVGDDGRWTGKTVLVPVEEVLAAPLKWRKPRRVFVNSMSDLFHESVPDEWIDQVFAVMAIAQLHTFQVLTKRAARMRQYVGSLTPERLLARVGQDFGEDAAFWAENWINGRVIFIDVPEGEMNPCDGTRPRWPLPNVWLGVSVEDQGTADMRIPLLLDTPAAVRFVSAEPLLGAVDMSEWLAKRERTHMCMSVKGALRNGAYKGFTDDDGRPVPWRRAKAELELLDYKGVDVIPMGARCDNFDDKKGCLGHVLPRIDWVIVGGESGPGARPMHPDWVRSIRDQCAAACVPFFFKQWGGVDKRRAGALLDGWEWREFPGHPHPTPLPVGEGEDGRTECGPTNS